MGALISKVFASAKDFFRKIGDAYDHTGMTAWRAMTDDSFLKSHTPFHLPYVGEIGDRWNSAKKKLQDGFFDLFHKKATTGDVAPKPGLKPAAIKLVKAFAPVAASIPWGGPMMKAGMATAVIIYAMSNTQLAADAMTAWQAATAAPAKKPEGGIKYTATEGTSTPSAQPSIS